MGGSIAAQCMHKEQTEVNLGSSEFLSVAPSAPSLSQSVIVGLLSKVHLF